MAEKTLETIWLDDMLDRKADADFLHDFLVKRMEERKAAGRSGSYVLNIDAGWGFGKSFFMERFKQQLELAEHPVVLIDAWKNDFSDDPYTNVIAEIEAYFQCYFDQQKEDQPALRKAYEVVKTNAAKIGWIALKGLGKRASRYVIAEGTDEILEVIDQQVHETGKTGEDIKDTFEKQAVEVTDKIIDKFAKKRMEEFNEARVSLERFRDSLSELLKLFEEQTARNLPFFILIDELDRCRPTYAIAMLERIKHLFDADNVVFVLSTDTTQLAHSINAVYGPSFDSRRYLQRFFTRSYELPEPNTQQIVERLMAFHKPDVSKWLHPGFEQNPTRYLSDATIHYKMSLRESEQAIDILMSLTTVWQYRFPIYIGIMFPLILGYLRREDITNPPHNEWLSRMVGSTNWSIKDQYLYQGREKRTELNNVGSSIKLVLGLASQYLDDTIRNGYEASKENFQLLQAHEYFQSEYNNRPVRRNGDGVRRSVVAEYPTLIRHAGRLSI
ncbi:KAP family P-loop NTPase fold protein [Neorhizobium alkalisoli]|uniref:KAP-like P-loop domain-containing protein n=1 Tax=Neorhizobium alkalisoli TaxID=528178 RepID=A0A561QV06_9HYPH|nr:P-loop NTPase fold protein [Neorhizobium alkalisoli]TWF54146.1 KAP-like P-loop domain-containing protein [Neorhizobium alkalisoli]